jgi:hypothetical protein
MPLRRTIHYLLLLSTLSLGCGLVKSKPPGAAAPGAPTAPPTSATTPNATIIAIAPPPAPAAPQASLCGFLGLDKIGAGAGGLLQRLASRIKSMLNLEGRFPGLQAKPPILSITDPANLDPSAPPAVQAAAEVKMDEDQAGQKIQALRYLAKIGCGGCYPTVEEALLSALDDCTEAVRYEATLALRGDGNVCCAYCRCEGCCSPAVRKKLNDISTKQSDDGCFAEPSERVRRMARAVLAACGGYNPAVATTPSEGPTPAPPPGEAGIPDSTVPTTAFLEPIRRSAVQLASFEQTVPAPSMHDTVLARVNGEPIYESHVVPLLEIESARRKLNGSIIAADDFQTLLVEELDRAVDAKLLLQQARRDLMLAGRPTAALSSAEFDAWLVQALNVDGYVSLTELTAYYQKHRAEFQRPPEVRWEQISIYTADVGSHSRALALANGLRSRALNEPDAPPVADMKLAETKVVEFTALDRVDRNVLTSSLTSLPVGKLSPILEDKDGLYMVRVLERRPGSPAPFDEVAETVRKEIMAVRREQAERHLVGRLRQASDVSSALNLKRPARNAAANLVAYPAPVGAPVGAAKIPTTASGPVNPHMPPPLPATANYVVPIEPTAPSAAPSAAAVVPAGGPVPPAAPPTVVEPAVAPAATTPGGPVPNPFWNSTNPGAAPNGPRPSLGTAIPAVPSYLPAPTPPAPNSHETFAAPRDQLPPAPRFDAGRPPAAATSTEPAIILPLPPVTEAGR